MRQDGKDNRDGRGRPLRHVQKVVEQKEVTGDNQHVVFDFTGLHKPEVSDLAMILTARLHTPPEESVWIRAIDPRTARVLRVLGLDHLFRHYPGSGEMH